MEFLLGNLDFLSGLHAVYKDELTTRSGELNPKYRDRFTLDTQPYLNTEYLGFLADTSNRDLLASPLSKLDFRKAINFGFDRAKMLKYLRNNLGTPAHHGFLPSGLPFYDQEAVQGFSYNPDSTRHYLMLAGFAPGVEIPEISLTTTADYLDLCEFIQFELSRFGIKISLEVATGGAYRNKMANGHLLFFRGSWIADYPDPENYLSLFYSPNKSPAGPNYTRFGDPLFDSLFEASMQTIGPTMRTELNTRMDQLIIDQAPVVPLFYDEVVRFYPNCIQGLQSNPLNILILKYVKKS
jgi:peptide/nickel transport system substrate-binding protein